MQAERMQGVGEMVRFELVAGDAGSLADGRRLWRGGVRCDARVGEARCQPREGCRIARRWSFFFVQRALDIALDGFKIGFLLNPRTSV